MTSSKLKYNNFYVVMAFVAIMFIVMKASFSSVIINNSDAVFLWNRIQQIYSCRQDGIRPFFYYNDAYGVGYGSAFFYGQLLLFPISYLVPFGQDSALTCYFLLAVLANYFGAVTLAKRFTKDYNLVALLYIISPSFYQFNLLTALISCRLGVGIGMFFLAYCVDAFRDNKSCIPAVLSFWVLFNTHTLTTVVCFIGCVMLWLYYFKWEQIKSYIVFVALTVLCLLYNLANYLYHIDCLHTLSDLNTTFSFDKDYQFSMAPYTHDWHLVTGGFRFFHHMLDSSNAQAWIGIRYFTLLVLIMVIYGLCKEKYSRKKFIVLIGLILASVVSVTPVWSALYNIYRNVFQFPIRYTPYVIVLLLIIGINRTNWHKYRVIAVILGVLDLLVFIVLPIEHPPAPDTRPFDKFGLGEYLSDNFTTDPAFYWEYSSNVIGEDGTRYSYEIDKNKVYINLDANVNGTISVPKLYYNGYIAKDFHGNNLPCYEGEGMFVNVDVTNAEGSIEVYYQHPLFLRLLYCVSMTGVVTLIIVLCKNKFKIRYL